MITPTPEQRPLLLAALARVWWYEEWQGAPPRPWSACGGKLPLQKRERALVVAQVEALLARGDHDSMSLGDGGVLAFLRDLDEGGRATLERLAARSIEVKHHPGPPGIVRLLRYGFTGRRQSYGQRLNSDGRPPYRLTLTEDGRRLTWALLDRCPVVDAEGVRCKRLLSSHPFAADELEHDRADRKPWALTAEQCRRRREENLRALGWVGEVIDDGTVIP